MKNRTDAEARAKKIRATRVRGTRETGRTPLAKSVDIVG
jgi:hypothetical protein